MTNIEKLHSYSKVVVPLLEEINKLPEAHPVKVKSNDIQTHYFSRQQSI